MPWQRQCSRCQLRSSDLVHLRYHFHALQCVGLLSSDLIHARYRLRRGKCLALSMILSFEKPSHSNSAVNTNVNIKSQNTKDGHSTFGIFSCAVEIVRDINNSSTGIFFGDIFINLMLRNVSFYDGNIEPWLANKLFCKRSRGVG